MTTIVHLPKPPSLNNLFFNVRGRGRVITRQYSNWKANAIKELLVQKPKPVHGDVMIDVRVGPRSGDLDNRLKALFDVLVEGGVIDDDRKVVKLTAQWDYELNGATVTIIPRHVEAA